MYLAKQSPAACANLICSEKIPTLFSMTILEVTNLIRSPSTQDLEIMLLGMIVLIIKIIRNTSEKITLLKSSLIVRLFYDLG